MADNDVLIQIRADVADINAKLVDVKGYIGKVTDETKKMSDQSKGFLETAQKYWVEFTVAIYAAYRTISKGWDLAENAAIFEQQKYYLNRLAGYYGTTADQIIADVQRASAGLLSMKDIVSVAGDAMVKRLSPDQLTNLAEAALTMSRLTGKGISEIFSSMEQAIGSGRTRAINMIFGIIDLTTKYTDKQISSMSLVEQTQAKYAMVMEYVNKLHKSMGDEVDSTAEKMQRFTVNVKNLQLELGQGLIRAFAGTTAFIYEFIAGMQTANAIILLVWAGMKRIQMESGTPETGPAYPVGSPERNQLQAEIDEVNQSILDFLNKKPEYEKKAKEMWDIFTAPTGQLAKAIDPQSLEMPTKKVSDAWAVFQDKLKMDVAKQGMEEFQQKLLEIAHQAKDYQNQWGKREIIDWWKNNKVGFEEMKHAIDEQIKDWNSFAQIVERTAKTRLEHEKSMYAERAKQGEYSPVEQMNAELDFEKQALEIEKARLAVQLHSAYNKIDSADKQREIMELTAQEADLAQKILDIEDKRTIKQWGMSDLGGQVSALKNFAQQASDTGKQLGEAWDHAFKNMTDALTDFVITGKLNFTDFANSVIRDLVRIYIQSQITGPLSGALSGWLKGLSGYKPTTDTSGLGDVISGWEAKGDAFQNGHIIRFGSGGIVNRPTLFRMATGAGLMGEVGPEGILPLGRTPSGDLGVKSIGGGGGNVTINIVNNAGVEVSTQTQETQQGKTIDVMIDQAVAKKLSQRGSSSSRALKQNYGARERLVAR